ncbi:unnamed protein product [Rotaria socialis]|uniref:Uncharacterized protein n=1 Tax=Rotaria socialis TaxID=392032 RepID=A0A818DE76_9BILA|nr:unnamed protein product [Rotaria socialis]
MCSKNSGSSPDDIIDVTQENNTDSNNVGCTLLSTSKIACKMIYNLLIHKDPRVILVENTKKHTSDCWNQFRYPVIIDDKGVVVTKLDKFVSCKYCSITFSYNNNSTSQMNKHDCRNSPVKCSTKSDSTSSLSFKQKKVLSFTCNRSGSIKLNEEEEEEKCRYYFITCSKIIANEYRSNIRQKLIEPLLQQAVTICPNMWSDSHRQVSYLGISVCFTDENYQFFAYDLCCQPYTEADKSAENIIIPFGITDLSQINFVSDRGSNLAKALKPYSPAYCVDYRLNNIIKKCFYQTGKIKYKADDYITNETNELVCSSDSEDDNDVIDIPSSAANILKTILSCKNLVKFVKQSGLNKIIQDQCGVAVLQATVVRWLSMSQLLESVNRSYRQIKKILGDRKKVIVLDKLIILQLIILLRTFKHIILFLQKGKEPTLHLVTIAIITLQYLLEYDQSYQENPSGEELQEDDEYLEENEGMRFFRIRLYQLLNIMFALEPIHLAATLLHP